MSNRPLNCSIACGLALLAFVTPVQSQEAFGVKIYGRVDAALARNYDVPINVLQNGSGSRLGFEGNEDLGGGMVAFFALENRFNVDTGAISDLPAFNRYFLGRSMVGLVTPYGQVTLGREYTPLFWTALFADPFGYDTINANNVLQGRVDRTWFSNSVHYENRFGKLKLMAAVAAEADGNPANPANPTNQTPADLAHKPYSASVTYADGPLYSSIAYTKGAGINNDHVTAASASYDFRSFKLMGGAARGRLNSGFATNSFIIGGTIPIGVGTIKMAIASIDTHGSPAFLSQRKFQLGYSYALSKRTSLYADVGRDTRALVSKNAIDLGLKHSF